MLKWIERTRKKPKAVRDQYAFMVAITITSIIALGWLVTLPVRFSGLTIEMEGVDESRGALSQFLMNTKDQAAAILEAGSTEVDQGASATSTDRWPIGTSSEDTTVSISSSTTATSTTPTSTSLTDGERNTQNRPRTVLIGTTSSRTASETDATQ